MSITSLILYYKFPIILLSVFLLFGIITGIVTCSKYAKDICADTLADELVIEDKSGSVSVDINGENFKLLLEKVK